MIRATNGSRFKKAFTYYRLFIIDHCVRVNIYFRSFKTTIFSLTTDKIL